MLDWDFLCSLGISELGVILSWDEALDVSDLGVILGWGEALDISQLGFIPGWDEALSASYWLPVGLLLTLKFVLLGSQGLTLASEWLALCKVLASQ